MIRYVMVNKKVVNYAYFNRVIEQIGGANNGS